MTKDKTCPICGQQFRSPGALSRRDNETEICGECGTAEAMEDFGMSPEEAREFAKQAQSFAKDYEQMKKEVQDEIRVLVYEQDKEPYEKIIKNDFKAMREVVGGGIECITILDGEYIITLDDEGKMKNKRATLALPNDDFIAGTCFIAKRRMDEMFSLTDEDIQFLKKELMQWHIKAQFIRYEW